MDGPRHGLPRRSELNLPNAITLARIGAVPAVMLLMALDPVGLAWPAALLFGLAAVTDFLDGYLARRFNQISDLGKFLDPLADKLLVLGPLMALVQLGRVSVWLAFLLLARELVVSTLRTLAMGRGWVMAARSLGKQKTLFQMMGLGMLMVGRPVGPGSWAWRPDFGTIGWVLLWLGVVLAWVSAADYLRVFSSLAKIRPGGAADDEVGPASPVDSGQRLGHGTAPSRE